MLYNLFPHAQFIHLMTHFSEKQNSDDQSEYGMKNGMRETINERQRNEMANLFKMTLPADQFTEISYEDLIYKPKNVFEHVFEFLKIEYSNVECEGQPAKSIESNLRNNGNLIREQFISKSKEGIREISFD